MPGAEVVHTFIATMRPDGGGTTAPRLPRAIASWSDAILFGRVAGCRGADPPRLIEEPAELRTQKRQGPPEGGHEHGARWLLGGKAVEQTVASGAPEIVLAATAVRTARQM